MYRLYATLMCLIIFAFLFTQRPVVLIVLISAFEAPVLSVSAIMLMYLFRKKLANSWVRGSGGNTRMLVFDFSPFNIFHSPDAWYIIHPVR